MLLHLLAKTNDFLVITVSSQAVSGGKLSLKCLFMQWNHKYIYRKIKDPVTVKNALGHSSITTTMVYVHLVGSDVEKALSGGD